MQDLNHLSSDIYPIILEYLFQDSSLLAFRQTSKKNKAIVDTVINKYFSSHVQTYLEKMQANQDPRKIREICIKHSMTSLSFIHLIFSARTYEQLSSLERAFVLLLTPNSLDNVTHLNSAIEAVTPEVNKNEIYAFLLASLQIMQEVWKSLKEKDNESLVEAIKNGGKNNHNHYYNLSRANLQYCQLYDTIFWYADLTKINLENAWLGGSNIVYSKLIFANFKGILNLREVDIFGSDLTGANFEDSDLTGMTLKRVKLHRCNLKNTTLKKAHIRKYIKGLTSEQLVDTDIENAELPKNLKESIEALRTSIKANETQLRM